MRRILAAAIGIGMMLCCTICGYAAESEHVTTSEVYGKYNYSTNPNITTAVSDKGNYTIVTEDGTRITVEYDDEDLLLVVHRITESDKQSYEWFQSCVDSTVAGFTPYDIYFLKSTGERVELPTGTKVTMSVSSSTQYIMGLSYDGNTYQVDSSHENGAITFSTDEKCGYYLLCEMPADMQSPQTGEKVNTCLWIIGLMLSGCVICIMTKSSGLHVNEKR